MGFFFFFFNFYELLLVDFVVDLQNIYVMHDPLLNGPYRGQIKKNCFILNPKSFASYNYIELQEILLIFCMYQTSKNIFQLLFRDATKHTKVSQFSKLCFLEIKSVFRKHFRRNKRSVSYKCSIERQ